VKQTFKGELLHRDWGSLFALFEDKSNLTIYPDTRQYRR